MVKTSRPDMPNLVFILPDRLRQDTMACYGNEWIQSPHLNRFAEQSFIFDNCYVTQPVCAPARASLMTGLYPPMAGMSRNRLVMPPEIQAVAQMVSPEYTTGYIGKWHLGDEIVKQRGFDHWVSSNDYWWPEYTDPADRERFSDYHRHIADSGYQPEEPHPGGPTFSQSQRAALPPGKQMASFLANRAAEFIEENAGNPFILYVSTIEPHPPFSGPYNGMYDPSTLPVDDTFMRPPEGSSLLNRLKSELFGDCVRDGISTSTEAGWRQLRANYFGNVRLVDNMAGTILGALSGNGLDDSAIVVFTSEHGDMIGTHNMLEMRTPYEEATKVPLLVRVPWLSEGGERVPGNFSQIDMAPTLLDLLGQPVPGHLQGVSRADVLEGKETLQGNDVVVQHNGVGDRDLTDECDEWSMPASRVADLNYMNTLPWRSIVTADRWKLTLCIGDQAELYDLNTDPGETRNLFGVPGHRDRVRAMAARLHLWQSNTGDTAPLPGV